jgi:hypothetical protein
MRTLQLEMIWGRSFALGFVGFDRFGFCDISAT